MVGFRDNIRLGRIQKMWKGSVEFLGFFYSYLEYTVKMGDVKVIYIFEMAVKVLVRDIVIYRDYIIFGLIENDIVFVLFVLFMNYFSYIQFICFFEKIFMVLGETECWVIGWGSLRENGEIVM